MVRSIAVAEEDFNLMMEYLDTEKYGDVGQMTLCEVATILADEEDDTWFFDTYQPEPFDFIYVEGDGLWNACVMDHTNTLLPLVFAGKHTDHDLPFDAWTLPDYATDGTDFCHAVLDYTGTHGEDFYRELHRERLYVWRRDGQELVECMPNMTDCEDMVGSLHNTVPDWE